MLFQFSLVSQLIPPRLKELSFLGNTLGDYADFAAALVVFLIVFKIFQWIILTRLKRLAEKTETDLDDTLIQIVRSLRPPFYSFLAVYLALPFLDLSPFAFDVLTVILTIWVVYQVTIAIQIMIDYVVRTRMAAKGEEQQESVASFLSVFAKILVWTLGLLFVLSNFGVNVTSLLAALGVGGIAVAFALQNILGDLFSSFAIYFDKPFVAGDFIMVGDKLGTVEKIGIKTTRLTSLRGEELVFSNTELTSAKIHNFGQMKERRITVPIGVTYSTPLTKLKRGISIIQEAVESTDQARFDRAHFHGFGDSSLAIETVYYVTTDDYNVYMDVNQEILFKIKEGFEKEGIEFAFPTRTVHLEK